MNLPERFKPLSSLPKRAAKKVVRLATRREQDIKQRRNWVRRILLLMILTLAIFAYSTNPFVRFSIVTDPYKEVVILDEGSFDLVPHAELVVKSDAFFKNLAKAKSGWHILTGKVSRTKKSQPGTADEIISQIHQLRFDPDEPFLISGDHFSVLYARSLGIFYHSLLDPRTAHNQEDWERRQLIYLKTLAYALQAYKDSEYLTTTIVPVGPRSVALVNFHSPPSDTLYSLLIALDQLQSSDSLTTTYPFESAKTAEFKLKTTAEANQLLAEFTPSLQRHYQNYLRDLIDPATGLIKKELILSGTKDMTIKESGFYDNVILWKTMQLAQELGLVEENQLELDTLKQKILTTFWNEKTGYFEEDLSALSDYSSDWLIAYQVGMLSPENEADLVYLEKSLEYIEALGINEPFGVQYNPERRLDNLHLPVRVFAPDYGSTAIWSHWGMEYTKLLAHMSQATGDQSYLAEAQHQIDSYTYNIERYRGYPELYSQDGDIFSQRGYKSIRQTGWVVNFELAREMVQETASKLSQ